VTPEFALLKFLPSTIAALPGNARSMPKTLLYSLAAIVDIIFAVIAYRSGRIVIPVILVFACICFVIAAIGTARGSGVPK
jgi:hypothetical protein